MKLKIDKDFKNLIPSLTSEELEKLEDSILAEGIRDSLITWNKTIVDGHNRYDIAKKHNLEFEIMEMDFESKEDAINWMLNNQLGRRNLTTQQRVDVLFGAEELIKSIYEKGKMKHVDNAKNTTKKREGRFCSTDQKRESPHNSREKIAKLAKTSPATVGRMKKVRKEDPESYKEVVDGKKTIYKAYTDLPTVTDRRNNKFAEGKRDDVKKEDPLKTKMTESEIKKEMFNANVSTFFRHLSEIEGFVGRTEDFKEVVNESINRDSASMQDYKVSLNEIIKLMEVSQ